jgi:hypothetical protein
MRIQSVVVTPNEVYVGESVTIKVLVLDNQGFITKDKLLLKTKDGSTFIVKDT